MLAITSRLSALGQQPPTIIAGHSFCAGFQARHARRAGVLRPNVLAAERPPGYIQRPARRSPKKQPRNTELQPGGDGAGSPGAAGAASQAAAEQQQQQQEQQHAQQQLWQEQQVLLQEQWQKQKQQEQQLQQHLQQQQQQQQGAHWQEPQQPAQRIQQRQQQSPQQQHQQTQQHRLSQQQQQQQRRRTSGHGSQQPSSTSSAAAAHVQQSSRQMQPALMHSESHATSSSSSSRSRSRSDAHSSARSSSSSSSSLSRLVVAAPAYSVVPTATAPSVAAAATRAVAKAAATAAAAAGSATSSGGLPAVLPRAEQSVPRQFWGLMKEELRPWHREVLVQLCFYLPPPACYVYRDMRAGTMQGVLAQRAMLEKAVRAGLLELDWQARRMRGWLGAVSREGAPGCVAPELPQQAQQELADLKASLGATRSQLAALQSKARAYSDVDYAEYSSRFDVLLLEMQALADVLRQQQAPLVLRLQETLEAAARRALFAPTSAAAAAAQSQAAAAVSAELACAGPMRRDTTRRLFEMRQEMQQQLDWRYPPREYVLWRVKGRPGASRPPLEMPGLKRAVPAVRQGVQQLPRTASE